MNFFISFFRILCCLFLLGSGFLRSDWEIVKYERGEYVTLRSFCKFYKFNYPESSLDQEEITLKSADYKLKLRKGSRNCFLNGARIWSTYNIVQNDQDWLISRKDVSKFFDPILRPSNLTMQSEVRGVVIDPGHGGEDRGAVSRKGIREKDMALDTGFRLEKVLKSRGISTVMTRRKDVFIELEQRATIAARYPGYIFVSLHYNDASGSARGIETYCFPALGASSTEYEGRIFKRDSITMPGNRFDVFNIFLATSIHQEIIKLNPNDEEADRGVKRARFVVLKENRLPGVLVEGGFLSNRTESSRISSPEYRQSLAEKIANGIENYFNRRRVPEKPVPIIPPMVVTSSTNSSLKKVQSTNQVSVNSSTNLSQTLPPPVKSTNAVSIVTTNRVLELPPLSKPEFSTNSVLQGSNLFFMTNRPASTNLYEKPFRLNPEVNSLNQTHSSGEISTLQPTLEKRVEPPPQESAPPMKPRSEASEDSEISPQNPEVEIYMQNTSPTRVPEVSIRPIEVQTNTPPSEVKP